MTSFTNRDPLDLPVLAITEDGEKATTFAKALNDLNERDRIAKQAKQIRAVIKAEIAKREKVAKQASQIRALINAELARRKRAETEKIVRKTIKARRLAELSELQAAKSQRTLKEAEDAYTRTLAEWDQVAARIATVERNLAASAGQVRLQKELQAAAVVARADREADEWLFKANSVTDPILRSAYLARSEGRHDDN